MTAQTTTTEWLRNLQSIIPPVWLMLFNIPCWCSLKSSSCDIYITVNGFSEGFGNFDVWHSKASSLREWKRMEPVVRNICNLISHDMQVMFVVVLVHSFCSAARCVYAGNFVAISHIIRMSRSCCCHNCHYHSSMMMITTQANNSREAPACTLLLFSS